MRSPVPVRPPSTALRPTVGRLLGAGLLAAGFTAVSAGVAEAHISVSTDNAASGSIAELTFRVPNESDTTGTVKVEVQLPQDKPFRSVSTASVPGWTVELTEEPLPTPVEADGVTLSKAVRTVTWTADEGVQIGPKQYQNFPVSVGPLPAPGPVALPATQTNSDGEVQAWAQPLPAAGGPEPEFPAPQIEVTATDGAGAETTSSQNTGTASTSVTAGPDTLGRWLGGGAFALALASLLVSVANYRQRKSSTS